VGDAFEDGEGLAGDLGSDAVAGDDAYGEHGGVLGWMMAGVGGGAFAGKEAMVAAWCPCGNRGGAGGVLR
jgi:hypothetical protein